MSGQKRRSGRSRRSPKVRPDPVTFWREDELPPEPAMVAVPHDPTATLRSLGNPSLPNGETAANEFLKATLRASALVGALAKSVDLVDDQTDESTT